MIAINQLLRRARRRLTLAAVFAGLVLAVAAHHSELAMDHPATGAIVTLCLGVITVAATVTGAPARPSRVLAWLVPPTARPPESVAAGTIAPPARAGPAELQVFLD